jgi:hypothetical protein
MDCSHSASPGHCISKGACVSSSQPVMMLQSLCLHDCSWLMLLVLLLLVESSEGDALTYVKNVFVAAVWCG